MAQRIAGEAGFEPRLVVTESFVLQTYFRPSRNAAADAGVNVYIEGDGLAWRTRTRASSDPTPANPLGLELAAADASGAAVLYVARPCQYVLRIDERCEPSVWTGGRFSEQVVLAVDRAIDVYVDEIDAASVELLGYSGGGVVAALVAARRSDVRELVTFAAPLDHRAWTGHHGVSALEASLNPIDYAAGLQRVRQVHFVGAADTVVPEAVVDAFLNRLGDGALASKQVLPMFDHGCCWVEWWGRQTGRPDTRANQP